MDAQPLVSIYDHFRAQVHWPFLRAIMVGLVHQYSTAALVMEEYAPDREGVEALPHFKRALIDQMLRFEALKFPGCVQAESVPNAICNSYHTEVYAGPFTLTAHYIPTSDGGARAARYRDELAENHPDQYTLFAPEVSADAKLYGHILHGSAIGENGKVERGKVGFVYVKFPLPGSPFYSTAFIDLIAEFPEIFGQTASVVSQVTDDASPALLPQQGFGDAGA